MPSPPRRCRSHPFPGPLSAESVAANLAKRVEWTRRCVEATGAELVVLPESATTGFTPGCPTEELWELVSELPGPIVEPLRRRSPPSSACTSSPVPTSAGPTPEIVYNASVLIDPRGELLGVYRKTHPFCTEAVIRWRLGDPGRHRHRLRHRARPDRHDHLLRR